MTDWISAEADPVQELDSLPGVAWHMADAWTRRDDPNVLLVHYADLAADLEGQMRAIARRLSFDVDETGWSALVNAASFNSMRSRADVIAPATGVLKSSAAFFRRGATGEVRELLTADEVNTYDEGIAALLPRDVAEWLNR